MKYPTYDEWLDSLTPFEVKARHDALRIALTDGDLAQKKEDNKKIKDLIRQYPKAFPRHFPWGK